MPDYHHSGVTQTQLDRANQAFHDFARNHPYEIKVDDLDFDSLFKRVKNPDLNDPIKFFKYT